MKACTKCGEVKPLTAFSKSKRAPDGLMYTCKTCNNKYSKLYRNTATGIYTQIKARSKFYKRHVFNITRTDFVGWHNSQPQICHYCELPAELLEEFMSHYGSRWFRLTIDCKDNELGYVKGNLVLACDKCNSIKSNILSYEEMLYIGKTFIKPKWNAFFGPTTMRDENGS